MQTHYKLTQFGTSVSTDVGGLYYPEIMLVFVVWKQSGHSRADIP